VLVRLVLPVPPLRYLERSEAAKTPLSTRLVLKLVDALKQMLGSAEKKLMPLAKLVLSVGLQLQKVDATKKQPKRQVLALLLQDLRGLAGL
jgi:hypothetical protein